VTVVIYTCDKFFFKNFGAGVYKNAPENCEDTQISHAALVVGYGVTEHGEKYWELVNSYSEDWGTNGRIKLARGVDWEN